jgi:hypothetical protein
MNENMPVIINQTPDNLPVKQEAGIQPLDLENISALHTAEPAPFDLMCEYWSPENKGEQRRVMFDRIQTMSSVDQASGEMVELVCAFFYYQELPGGPIKQIRNGSKRLVGAIEAFGIPKHTPLLIKYMGKIKNKNNANLSDNWSITPLVVNVSSK